MTESEIVKTCVVLMPCAAFIIVTIIGAIHEAIRQGSVKVTLLHEGGRLICDNLPKRNNAVL